MVQSELFGLRGSIDVQLVVDMNRKTFGWSSLGVGGIH